MIKDSESLLRVGFILPMKAQTYSFYFQERYNFHPKGKSKLEQTWPCFLDILKSKMLSVNSGTEDEEYGKRKV